MNTFESLEAFYWSRGGSNSGESDFGVWWTGPDRWPRYRISVVHDTGDIYAFDFRSGSVLLLATVAQDCPNHGILRRGPACAYDRAEALLEGWVDAIHEPNSLQWVRERLAGVAA